MKKKFLLLVLMLSVVTLRAQSLSINGVEIQKCYTNEQIVAALGEPDKVASSQEFPQYRDYRYATPNSEEQDLFVIEKEDGMFVAFALYSSKFKINNKLKVGDNISKLAEMGGRIIAEDGLLYWYSTNSSTDDCAVMVYHNPAGVIEHIYLGSPM